MRAVLPVLLMLAAVPSSAEAPSQMPGWMAGCWQEVNGERWTDECWTAPRAGLMIGASRTGTGETLQFFEHSRVETAEDGTLVFVAMPRGAPARPSGRSTAGRTGSSSSIRRTITRSASATGARGRRCGPGFRRSTGAIRTSGRSRRWAADQMIELFGNFAEA